MSFPRLSARLQLARQHRGLVDQTKIGDRGLLLFRSLCRHGTSRTQGWADDALTPDERIRLTMFVHTRAHPTCRCRFALADS